MAGRVVGWASTAAASSMPTSGVLTRLPRLQGTGPASIASRTADASRRVLGDQKPAGHVSVSCADANLLHGPMQTASGTGRAKMGHGEKSGRGGGQVGYLEKSHGGVSRYWERGVGCGDPLAGP